MECLSVDRNHGQVNSRKVSVLIDDSRRISLCAMTRNTKGIRTRLVHALRRKKVVSRFGKLSRLRSLRASYSPSINRRSTIRRGNATSSLNFSTFTRECPLFDTERERLADRGLLLK